jgi:hypothetical protein
MITHPHMIYPTKSAEISERCAILSKSSRGTSRTLKVQTCLSMARAGWRMGVEGSMRKPEGIAKGVFSTSDNGVCVALGVVSRATGATQSPLGTVMALGQQTGDIFLVLSASTTGMRTACRTSEVIRQDVAPHTPYVASASSHQVALCRSDPTRRVFRRSNLEALRCAE